MLNRWSMTSVGYTVAHSGWKAVASLHLNCFPCRKDSHLSNVLTEPSLNAGSRPSFLSAMKTVSLINPQGEIIQHCLIYPCVFVP